MRHEADVIVLGAGMAGLAAAHSLLQRNQRVLVLEARGRVGGRILTRTLDNGQSIELGAEFVHGRAPELWALIDEAGVVTAERDGSMLREGKDGLEDDDDRDDEFFAPLEALEGSEQPDEPFAAWLDHSDVPAWQREALTGYVEGFNAADAARIGIRSLGVQQKAEDEIGGDRAWHIHGGYAQLAEYLAARIRGLRGEIHLQTPIESIEWTRGDVRLTAADGQQFHAPRLVVTAPLGVLQKINTTGGLRMCPEPQALAHARRMAMGDAARFTLVFNAPWWQQSTRAAQDALTRMSFLFTFSGVPAVWWTAHPEHEALPTLTGWAGGPRAASLAGRSPAELARAACSRLAAIFGVEEDVVERALHSVHMHDWKNDPYSLGAYSYVPAGAIDAPARMCEPEAGTIFLAGEHTDTTGHWGTVHAALRTGLRVAGQVLESL